MQKALINQDPSENHCDAGDTVEDVDEIDTECRQSPSEDDRFASCGSLTTSICWEAMKKNSDNCQKD